MKSSHSPTISEIEQVLINALELINANPALANEALIKLAAMSAGMNGVDNRSQASALFNAVWELAYSDTH